MSPADALVIFGVTGDLAFKKIFPALARLLERGRLDVPILGVARGNLDLERLRARVRESARLVRRADAHVAREHLPISTLLPRRVNQATCFTGSLSSEPSRSSPAMANDETRGCSTRENSS